jgi:hypothetical protein
MSRLETARYDEALERYRANAYRLRRLVLTGDARQRNQVCYVALQQWVDALVSRFLDANGGGPKEWLAETLEPGAAFSGGAAALAAAMGGAEAAATSGGAGGSSAGGKVSPLEAVMWHLTRLVNPGGGAGIVPDDDDDEQERGGQGLLLEVVGADERAAEALRQLMLAASDGGNGKNNASSSAAASVAAPFPFSAAPTPHAARLVEVDVLEPHEAAQLARYLATGEGPLQWKRPPAAAPPTLRSALALATHRRLFGTVGLLCAGGGEGEEDEWQDQDQDYEGGGAVVAGMEAAAKAAAVPPTDDVAAVAAAAARAGPLAGQRPRLRGRYAARLAVLRDYLGEALIHALEARRMCVRRLLVQGSAGALAATAGGGLLDDDDPHGGGGGGFDGGQIDDPDDPPARGHGLLDLDADLFLAAHEQRAMLEWLDALWACFLEDADRLRRAVGVRSYASAQPLDEFRVESSRAFLSLLAAWRDAVVARLMAPDAALAAAAAYGAGDDGGGGVGGGAFWGAGGGGGGDEEAEAAEAASAWDNGSLPSSVPVGPAVSGPERAGVGAAGTASGLRRQA